MKIAFTSCMSATAYPSSQKVWSHIAAQQPDAMVLLGDSIYNDVWPLPDDLGHTHPSEDQYQDHAFAVHMHRRYQKQLAIPDFAQLIHNVPTYAIWDDHDFLWNDAGMREALHPSHRGAALYSANLMRCWRAALLGHKAFPSSVNTPGDPRVQATYPPPADNTGFASLMPGYSVVKLGPQVWLHLSDGRSCSTMAQTASRSTLK